MIPMRISPEKYAHHFRPSADVLIVQRFLPNYESIGNIHLPDGVKVNSIRFSTVGKVLAVSDLVSETPWIEYMKDEIRKAKYIGYSFHVTVECAILPQFEVAKDVSIIQVHVRDVTQVLYEFEQLMDEHHDYELAELEKNKDSGLILQQERELFLGAKNESKDTSKSIEVVDA